MKGAATSITLYSGNVHLTARQHLIPIWMTSIPPLFPHHAFNIPIYTVARYATLNDGKIYQLHGGKIYHTARLSFHENVRRHEIHHFFSTVMFSIYHSVRWHDIPNCTVPLYTNLYRVTSTISSYFHQRIFNTPICAVALYNNFYGGTTYHNVRWQVIPTWTTAWYTNLPSGPISTKLKDDNVYNTVRCKLYQITRRKIYQTVRWHALKRKPYP